MRYCVHILSTLIAYLSFASLAGAQTTTTPQSSQAPASAKDNVEDLTQTILNSPPPPTLATAASTAPPSAPTAPAAQPSTGTSSISASSSTRTFPVPTTTKTPSSEAADCSRNPTHTGFYLRVTTGFSYVSLAGTGPTGTAKIAGLGDNSIIAIGGSIARGLVLAGTIQSSEVTKTFKGGPFVGQSVTTAGQSKPASDKADAAASEIGLFVDWYPRPTGGWHVGLSAGLGAASVVNYADNSTMAGASAAGSIFGGYDWAIGSDWSIGLALVGAGAGSATMKDSSEKTDTGYRLRSFSFGLAGSILYF